MPTVGGMNVSWLVSVCPLGAWLVNIYISKYISVFCWIYATNNFGSICKLNEMLVLDTHHLKSLLERSGVGLGNIHF